MLPKRIAKAGHVWLYSNWDFNAAGYAFEKMTGKKILRCASGRPRKADPDAGLRPASPANARRSEGLPLSGLPYVAVDSRHGEVRAPDARPWGVEGKQLVPANWVKESTSVLTPIKELHPADAQKFPWGYGDLWWVWDSPFNAAFKGAYTSRGAFGQYIAGPPLNMVLAHKNVPTNRFFADSDWLQLVHRAAGDRPASEIVLPVLAKQGRAAAIAKYNAVKSEPGIISDESDLFVAGTAADLSREVTGWLSRRST